MKKKLKILWYGDSPLTSTGFGRVTKYVVGALHDEGHDIEVVGINGYELSYDKKLYPYRIHRTEDQQDIWNYKRFIEVVGSQNWDLVIVFNDINIAIPLLEPLEYLKKENTFKTMLYTPIDTDAIPSEYLKGIAKYDTVVTYTDWGKKVIEDNVHNLKDKIHVIGHGTDSSVFYPLSENKIKKARKEIFNINDDTFLISNINRNQWRKDLSRTMLAYKYFKQQVPNSLLYIHAKVQDQGGDLSAQAISCGLDITKDVMFTAKEFSENKGYTEQDMNRIFNASDLVVSTTLGEGWGLSLIESMATRTPTLFPDNTAISEISDHGKRGFLIKSGETKSLQFVYGDSSNFIRPLTDVDDMISKMKMIYDEWKATKYRGGLLVSPKIREAYDYTQLYTWKKIGEEWITLIDQI